MKKLILVLAVLSLFLLSGCASWFNTTTTEKQCRDPLSLADFENRISDFSGFAYVEREGDTGHFGDVTGKGVVNAYYTFSDGTIYPNFIEIVDTAVAFSNAQCSSVLNMPSNYFGSNIGSGGVMSVKYDQNGYKIEVIDFKVKGITAETMPVYSWCTQDNKFLVMASQESIMNQYFGSVCN